MTSTVPRTCTELVVDQDRGLILTRSQPLNAFDLRRAYVLLGDAGSGKTTEFKREAEALGNAAELLSARNFTTLDVDSHTEWQEKILFIDGLDEMRAGTTDSLTPLDQIRNRLDRLGRPWFRISCREADWLGNNDRQSLADVSPDSQITVLRLDPLDDDGIRALLTSLDLPGDVGKFIDQARQQGLGAILHNPQTLNLLAQAVEQGGKWPDSRQETFELACQRMASERNEDHLERADHISADAAMDAAGYLCGLQLFAGTEGYSLSRLLDSASFPSVEELQDPPTQLPDNSLMQALSTRLFTGVVERRFSPVHRHIAEFLAGRYLAKLIENGLPVERVMALMTSPSDQRVVTVLRGLSAWLAVHSPTARRRLIDLDPVGVGLYGDIKDLRPDDKRLILASLAAFAEQGPLFGHERTDDRGGWHMGSTAQAFRSLASAEMVPAINELIAKPITGSRDSRVMEFLLDVLSVAEDSELVSLRGLAPDLETIVRDPTRPEEIKTPALDAFIRIAPSGEAATNTLIRLLRDIKSGVVLDPDDQLRGTLLRSLYPTSLSPVDLWRYAMPRNQHNLSGRYDSFLAYDLLTRTSSQQIAGLLDALGDNYTVPNTELRESMLHDLPFKLLARGLEECGEETDLPRLYGWLSIVADPLDTFHWEGRDIRPVQTWLEDHPDIQKAIFLAWLRHCDQADSDSLNSIEFCDVLLGSSLPSDFGRWCLAAAVELSDTEPSVAQDLLTQSYHLLQDHRMNEGLSLDILRSRTLGHGGLEQRLEELCTPRPPNPELSEAQQRRRALLEERREEERRQQLQRESDLQSQVTELRDNRFFPRGLHSLAQVYFGKLGSSSQDATSDQRIREFIGGDPDPDLVDAVLVALRGAVYRDDIPEADETISLKLDSKFSFLALPVLASLGLLYNEDPALLGELDDTLKRNALAIHYCVSPVLNLDPNQPMPWFTRLLEHDHELVLQVLFQCAHAAMRAGVQFPPGLSELDRIEHTHPILAHELTTRLLASFPVRARQAQIPLLDRLLERLLKAGKPELKGLVEEKLAMKSMDIAQQIRWLTVGALLSPERHLATLEGNAGKSQTRVRYFAEFTCDRFRNGWFTDSPLVKNLCPQVVAAFIRLMGSSFAPIEIVGMGAVAGGPELDASWRIQELISLLSSNPSPEANRALRDLINNPQLQLWKDQLRWAEERQRVLLRDATYAHLSIEQVQRTLDNGLPANVADLVALLNDHLNDISRDIRGSSSNIWRQFWKEDRESDPREPKHEESCRDALLAILKERLPTQIDSAPEGRYVSDRRADIRVSFGGFNVPIEIKKNSHRHLWDAPKTQLVDQYSDTDPATSGHGIYLVLWFGADTTARSPVHQRPTTPDELRELLEGDLTPEQTGKISVRVLDVTKP
ncbi:MAG: hypothetical protein KTV68_18355 [Acidimicrobiia bacterium]|nr:hypothetical protein [Acidimicrobiia bacterium]